MSDAGLASRAVALPLGLVLGVGLFAGLAQWSADFDGAAVGLGLNTSGKHAVLEGVRIDGRGEHLTGVVDAVRGFKAAGHDVVLWLGASQLHAINDQQPDDELAVVIANRAAIARGSNTRYVLLSEPNGNLHELWALLDGLRNQATIDAVVLGFTYDDLREPGVRPSLRPLYSRAPVDKTILEEKQAESPAKLDTDQTPQLVLEDWLSGGVQDVFPPYGKRDQARAKLSALYRRGFSTWLFRFVRRPQERIPADRAAWNMRAFDQIESTLTQSAHVPLLVYQAPHRPGMKPFYHPRKAYDAFHASLAERAGRNHLMRFVDLETLVPAGEWGITNAGQPDVFHFTGRGHVALGQAIDQAVADMGL